MILFKILDISNYYYIDDNNNYYIKSKFLLDTDQFDSIRDLAKKKDKYGVVYGEIEPRGIDIHLNSVSHNIESIKVPTTREIRRLKLMKISGQSIDSKKFGVEFTLRILNTHWGKELKSLIDDKIPIRTGLRCAGSDDIKKIFTVDIYSS